ncbi:hypothetical protein GCK72_017602 [Caenorhabditis remanei]|uniref:Saposin B-type domain-containing protein n=1 Tax=Caenorhabditis remanei TaxID=31234 RepID=A0A6A5G7M8_CAERE|nr:hypothetical protein GCK72_017602 [Caenorhabditis remanei]KAF1751050.1 hypothetical protein GCK72_017602 [Caenorhabditis remanei]
MRSSLNIVLFIVAVEAQMEQLKLDLNPIHQLCQPCIFAATAVKNTNKSPTVKEAEKKTCNTFLKNDLVCNGAVEVAGIYLNWTPAEKICENFRMCSTLFDGKKKFRAPVREGKRPDELAMRVLKVFENDEFPMQRFSRQADPVNYLNFEQIQSFEKLLREHNTEISNALINFLTKFQAALNLYLNENRK